MKKTIWSFFIDNFRLTYILTIAIVIFGIFSIMQIPKESAPEVDFPIVMISTALPGAGAEDIEELVTNKIEARVQGLPEVDSVTSVSSQGMSQITISFDVDSSSKEKLDEVRMAVDTITSDLPDDATDPNVQRISFSDVPIATFSISGPYTIAEMKSYAEDIQSELERIEDVSKVTVVGAPEEKIEVTLLPERLAQFGLSASQVTQSIAQSNIDLPIGSIETAGAIYTVRFAGRITDIQDVMDISISSRAGTSVALSDIAEIKTSFPEGDTVTRFGSQDNAPESAILIDIYKEGGQGNILSIVDTAEEEIESLKETRFPADVSVTTIHSDAEYIRTDLTNLLSSGAMTIIIVIAVLVVFLGWREALIMSLQVPLTFFITFIMLNAIGYTINFLTLFSLILALGILIDTGIVVIESMFEKMSKGIAPRASALKTLSEFQAPLISGTLTTIFVFLPMILMTGIMGKFIRSIPVTVTIVLTAAIIISLAFLTTFAVRFLKVKQGQSEGGLKKIKEWITRVYAWYAKTISTILRNKKKAKKFLGMIALLFVIAIALPVIGIVKVEMFPSEDLGTFTISIENPTGTPTTVTNIMTQEIETFLENDDRVKNFISRIGSNSTISVNLVDERDETSQEIISEYEKTIPPLVDAEVSIGQEAGGPPQGSPVQVRLIGTSLTELEDAARTLATAISEIEGTKNVETGIRDSHGEFVFEINRAKSRIYGVSEMQIAQAIQIAISGSNATTIQKNNEEVDILVTTRFGQDSRPGHATQATVEDIQAITVSTPQHGMIPVSAFGEISLAPSKTSISHEDGDRVLTITADIEPGANAQVITAQVREKIPSLNLPSSVVPSFGGEAEEIAESFASLGQAMIIGMIAIFGLLVWQFKSYRQPLFVLMTIPLALIGVFFGLALTGNAISFPGFIGIVALSGIVVNNAIILIDAINTNRKEGMSIVDAIEEAGKSRLQPIILTTLTTVAGMTPLAFSSPTWAPLAISIMAGLIFSTVLTLFVVPILYLLFGEKNVEDISITD